MLNLLMSVALALVLAVSGCSDSSTTSTQETQETQETQQPTAQTAVTLPAEVKTFVDANPDLNLKITELNAADNWAEGKRWRGKTEAGVEIIVFEKDGQIESVRRKDLTFIWDRAGRK